ncbi:tRNA pseudouridine(55) synthase TruB [Cellulosilyticum sp. I15G10I2]|uniref:tRNA pseudouridine(55) synthase TruB n=1 Tax=Cellulosilyticum sp. I15G10I2 TaxID=1892843 RepID=UPI00085C28F7|nr:tRNA pseudouridine(55) synthase TruB [Cellulosilyticum sp. I15G10I2]
MFNGIINIYKEKGYTSHDVVAKARKIIGQKKIGHTGTLDPEAEGVLPLCMGHATKAVQYITDADKCYEAEVILGAYTTTEDSTGEIIETFDVNVTKEKIEEAVASFKGLYLQVPPMYSAIKINGIRLYELARKGIVVDRPQREVTIYECRVTEWLTDERFKIVVHCSKGTYIRTLCTDIGKILGCGAYMGELLRTKVGKYTLKDSVKLDFLATHQEKIQDYTDSIEEIFKELKKVSVKSSANKLLYNGNKLDVNQLIDFKSEFKNEIVRVYDSNNLFIALYKFDYKGNCLQVEKMFKNP